MIRFLAISVFSLIAFTACSLKTTAGLREVAIKKTAVENPYFSNSEIDYLYKAKIQLYGKNFGGILIIKKIGTDNHRVVFTTEFGSKLFDLEFNGDTFTKHFAIKDLDKKFIINILRKDFRLLVTEKAKVTAAYGDSKWVIYQTESDKNFNFYFFENNSERLEKIINTSKTKEKVEINFTSSEENIAETIVIKHNTIKLNIELEKFKNEHYAD